MTLRRLFLLVATSIMLTVVHGTAHAQCTAYSLVVGTPVQTPAQTCCYPITLTATERNAWRIRIVPDDAGMTFAPYTAGQPYLADTATGTLISIKNPAGPILGLSNQDMGQLCLATAQQYPAHATVQFLDQQGGLLCSDQIEFASCGLAPQGCLEFTAPTISCIQNAGALLYYVTSTVSNTSASSGSVSFSAPGATITPSTIVLGTGASQLVNLTLATGASAGSQITITGQLGAQGVPACSTTTSVVVPSCANSSSACAAVTKTVRSTVPNINSINGVVGWSGSISTSVPVSSISVGVVAAMTKVVCAGAVGGPWVNVPVTVTALVPGNNGPVPTNAITGGSIAGFSPQNTTHSLTGITFGPLSSVPMQAAAMNFQAQFPPPPIGCPDTLRFCVRYAITYVTGLTCDTTICHSIARVFTPTMWSNGGTILSPLRARKDNGDGRVQSVDRSGGRTYLVLSDDTTGVLGFSIPQETRAKGLFGPGTRVRISMPHYAGESVGEMVLSRNGVDVDTVRRSSPADVQLPLSDVDGTSLYTEFNVRLLYRGRWDGNYADGRVPVVVSVSYPSPVGVLTSPSYEVVALQPSKVGGGAVTEPTPQDPPRNVQLFSVAFTNTNTAEEPMAAFSITPRAGSRIIGAGSYDEDEGVMLVAGDEGGSTTGNEPPWVPFAGKSVTTSKNNARMKAAGIKDLEDAQARDNGGLVELQFAGRTVDYGKTTRPVYLALQTTPGLPVEVDFVALSSQGYELVRGTMTLVNSVGGVTGVNEVDPASPRFAVNVTGTTATITVAPGVRVQSMHVVDTRGAIMQTLDHGRMHSDAHTVATLNLGGYPSGWYAVQLRTEDGAVYTRPLVITR